MKQTNPCELRKLSQIKISSLLMFSFSLGVACLLVGVWFFCCCCCRRLRNHVDTEAQTHACRTFFFHSSIQINHVELHVILTFFFFFSFFSLVKVTDILFSFFFFFFQITTQKKRADFKVTGNG